MNKNQSQEQYNQIFQELKEEKMDWDFEDFLQKAENKEESPIIPIHKKPSLPKWFWMAASVLLVASLGIVYGLSFQQNPEEQAKFVESEIIKQKSEFIKENQDHEHQVAVHLPDSIAGAKKDSIFQENTIAEKDVLDDILSKRARIKKESKPRFVDNKSMKNTISADSMQYQDSYVIVNGKKITNEKEALEVTQYSLMRLGNKYQKSVASAHKNENYNDDY